jgi:hypothetical protein
MAAKPLSHSSDPLFQRADAAVPAITSSPTAFGCYFRSTSLLLRLSPGSGTASKSYEAKPPIQCKAFNVHIGADAGRPMVLESGSGR